jgi:hypothetical protein
VDAARRRAGELADALEAGGLDAALPGRTDPKSLARALRSWRQSF